MRAVRRHARIDNIGAANSTVEAVRRYYRWNHPFYRLLHSRDGAMHLSLSGEFAAHAEFISKYVSHIGAPRVLELACGTGYNLGELATRRPSADLHGIDLSRLHVMSARLGMSRAANVRVRVGDYHRLPYADGSFDVVFVIEGICHARDLHASLAEARRVLAPDGVLLVFDLFHTDDADRLDPRVRQSAMIVERALLISSILCERRWLDVALAAGLEHLHTQDLSAEVTPQLRVLNTLAWRFVRGRRAGPWARRFLPATIRQNAAAGLLLHLTVEAGAHAYLMIALRPAAAP